MTGSHFALFALQLATMLGVALLCGRIAERLGQPAILGEMVGGILLGPTLLGAIAPNAYAALFPPDGAVASARSAVISLGMLFFLFIAGQEVDVGDLRAMGLRPALIGLFGTVLPILAGVALVYALPVSFWGESALSHRLALGLFVGMTLANSANPVLARILMDLGLLGQPIGATLMTATLVDDLVNWTLFAVVLSELAPSGVTQTTGIAGAVSLVVLFVLVVLGIGRWLGPRALAWIRRRLPWPSGLIAVTALVVLLTSAMAEWLGLNAFLGAFLAGVALSGDRSGHAADHEAAEAHAWNGAQSREHVGEPGSESGDVDAGAGHAAPGEVIRHFALGFFAPIFFVSIGLITNYARGFDPVLFVVLLVAALVSKLGSVLLGARVAGMRVDRNVWAIAFGLNARGATGIILAGIGLAHRVIDERIFVALVLMCLVTTLIATPAMQKLVHSYTARPRA